MHNTKATYTTNILPTRQIQIPAIINKFSTCYIETKGHVNIVSGNHTLMYKTDNTTKPYESVIKFAQDSMIMVFASY